MSLEQVPRRGDVADETEKRMVMYEKARFSYSTDIIPRLYEEASRWGVPPMRLIYEAFEGASPIDLTEAITTYLDRLEGLELPTSSED